MNCHRATADTEQGDREKKHRCDLSISFSFRFSFSVSLCLCGINRSKNEIAEKSQRTGERLPP
jgi:hypothetical protein